MLHCSPYNSKTANYTKANQVWCFRLTYKSTYRQFVKHRPYSGKYVSKKSSTRQRLTRYPNTFYKLTMTILVIPKIFSPNPQIYCRQVTYKSRQLVTSVKLDTSSCGSATSHFHNFTASSHKSHFIS